MLKKINSIEGENVGTKKDLWYARGDHIPVLGHRGIKAKYSENTMVSFKAAIDLGDLLLNVEIKNINYETVDATVKMLKEYGLSDRSVIACFDADIIRYTKRTYPEMRTQGFLGRYMNNFTEDTMTVCLEWVFLLRGKVVRMSQ